MLCMRRFVFSKIGRCVLPRVAGVRPRNPRTELAHRTRALDLGVCVRRQCVAHYDMMCGNGEIK